MYKPIQYDNISKKEWSRFVNAHAHGNIFQTPEMYDVYNLTKNYEPVFVGVVDGAGNLVGFLLSVIQREFGGPLGALSSRCVTWGGPLISEELDKKNKDIVFDSILKEHNRIARKRAIYMQFRNLWDMTGYRKIFEREGYNYEDHLDILMDLTKGEEALWKDMNKKRRNSIRNAIKAGLIIKPVQNEKEMEVIYSVYNDVYKNAGLPLVDISMFLSSYRILKAKNMVLHLIAYYEGTPIGAISVLLFKKTMYDWYAGSFLKYRNKHPNDLLPWIAMKWGLERGYEIFDFGGAGKPEEEYGVRDFKMKFGGVVVNYGRYQNVFKKNTLRLAMGGLNMWKKVKPNWEVRK